MKRRLITVMILLFASFIMVSCDFGRNDDTTTETPTTQQPTTVAPTTAPPTSAGEVSYTVTFYDGDGSIFATQTVTEGDSATSPGTPTKAATAQYTYTFDEWSLSYSNVLGDMNIYPVFTETLNTYTVTFYDGDGSVLETQTIAYGSGATTPAQTPVKADEGADQFIFASWDLDFSNVTGDLSINPVFTTQFNRSVLLLMVETMFISEPNFGEEPEDPEEVLDDIMEMMDASDEEAMYYQLVDLWEMYEEIFSIRTGTELQDWYAATKTAGYDKTFYTTTLYNAMINGITNDFNNYTDEVAALALTISEDTVEISTMNSNITSLELEAANYCSLEVDSLLTPDCVDYWDQLKERLEREIAYYDELNFVTAENTWDFDWNTYDNLINIQEQLIYHSIVTEDQTEIDSYQDMLDDELSNLQFYEYNMYYPLLQSFEYYKMMDYDLYHSDNYSNLEVNDLAGTYVIKDHLLDLFNGNTIDYPDSDYHYYGLSQYTLEISYLENELEETTWYLEEMEEKLEETVVLYTLVIDPAYEQNFLDLFGTAYDMLDAAILTVDDAAFDMVFDLGMDVLLQSLSFGKDDSIYYGEQTDFIVSQSSGMMMNTMFSELMTAENIEMFADRLNTTISAVYGTLDQTDFNNAKILLFAFLEAQMLADGMDQVEVDAMILDYSAMYDEYVLYLNAFVPEVTSLLGSIDSAKAEAIETLINQDFGVMTDIDVTVLAAQGLEILIGDDSFDLSIPLKILANIYIDQNDELDYSPTEIAQIETDIDTYIADLLVLIATVSEYDSHFLTAAEVETVMELMQKVMMIPTWFEDDGLSYISDPIEPYDDSFFEEFVDSFMNGSITTEDAIILYQNIFGTIEEDETYYAVRSVQQYLLGITAVKSFDDVQVWMANLEGFGYTQAELITYIMDYIAWYSDEFSEGTPEFIEFLYDMFNDPTNYAASETVVNLLLDDVQNMVATMPEGSLELVDDLIDFVMMMEFYDGYESVDDLPFTPLEVYAFTQELSTFLKLRADTFDSADLLVLENYILLVITEYVEDMELDASEEEAEIARINGLVLKYIGFADEALTEFTNLLDGLTEADIELLFDTIEIMSQDSANIYQQVIMVAQTIDAIYDPATVDLDIIIEMFLEVYFDMEYETYNPTDLADTQDAWNLYIADLETMIATVAAYDINAMDPLNYPTLIELQQAVMYLGMMFEDPMDILINPPTAYMYDAMYLDSLISELFDVDVEATSEITALADSLITILGTNPGDYEGLYYEMLGIGSVLMSLDSVKTPQDLFAVYQAIKGLGYSNADIANMVTQGFMTFLYPELSAMSDISSLESEMDDLQSEIEDLLDVDLAAIETDVLYEISQISDLEVYEIPEAILAAQELWDAMKDEIAYYAAYDQAFNQYSWETEYFDYDLWFDIQDAVDEENYPYAEQLLMYIDGDSNPYYEIYYTYVEFKDYESIRISLEEEFIMNYGNLDTSFNLEYLLVDYMYNRASDLSLIYMEIADFEMQKQEVYSQIEDIENIIWLTGTLNEFLSVPANIAMTEDVMVVLLDQFEAWTNDSNLDVLDDIEMIIKNGPAGLTIADVALEIQMAGSFFSNFLSTVDAADEALLIDFTVALSASYCDSNYDATQAAVMKVYFETKIEEILPEVLDMPAILGTYLSSFDEAKTEAVFTQVVEMFILCPEDPNRDVREKIVIAALIDAAVGDTTLDYEGLVSPIYKIIYELQTLSGNPSEDSVEDLIDEFVDSLDDIIISAAIVADYDPVNISEAQILVLEEFFDYLDVFLTLLDPLM